MWLVPFKGRNDSACYNQNFLWNDNNIYIMDNHRAALWCWFQHLKKDKRIDFIHIDKHTDTLQSSLADWVKACPDLWAISIDDYLSLIYENNNGSDYPLFRWDNYGSIFLDKYANLINECVFATHGDGDAPNFKNVNQSDVWDLAGNLSYWIEESTNQWIVNVDLDYFFYLSNSDTYELFQSEQYIEQVFSTIKKHLDDKKIACLTLCLSPECCGSWDAAEALCDKAVNIMSIDFKLPKQQQ